MIELAGIVMEVAGWSNINTVVWKIFVSNYFIAKNN